MGLGFALISTSRVKAVAHRVVRIWVARFWAAWFRCVGVLILWLGLLWIRNLSRWCSIRSVNNKLAIITAVLISFIWWCLLSVINSGHSWISRLLRLHGLLWLLGLLGLLRLLGFFGLFRALMLWSWFFGVILRPFSYNFVVKGWDLFSLPNQNIFLQLWQHLWLLGIAHTSRLKEVYE